MAESHKRKSVHCESKTNLVLNATAAAEKRHLVSFNDVEPDNLDDSNMDSDYVASNSGTDTVSSSDDCSKHGTPCRMEKLKIAK
jgi:hypothetical protein